MPGLVPGIHVLSRGTKKDVDGRDKPGHDEKRFGLRPRAGDHSPWRAGVTLLVKDCFGLRWRLSAFGKAVRGFQKGPR
jgi:hypothetical protein